MRFLAAVLVAGLVVAGLVGSPSRDGPPLPEGADARHHFSPAAVSDGLSVDPAPDAWLNVSRPSLVVRILNTSFVPRVEATLILLDGQRLAGEWDATLRSVRATPDEPLPDGTHRVEVELRDATDHVLGAAWSFYQDTVPPRVDFDAVPPEADRRVFTVNGTVVEPNLVDVRVNGFSAHLEADRFSVPVLLWPGRNDLVAVSRDMANNVGLAVGATEWLPAPPANASYVTVFHGNASFTMRFPTGWEVEADVD
ncbi:MAG: hypothetical protein ACT4OI_06915, partial [Methanobacteriota archaeon]